MRKYVVFIFQSCWATFTNGLVASSAYPIILQKELAMGFPVPNFVKERLEGVPPKNKIKWEPLFEGLSGKGVRVPLPFVDNNKHLSKLYFYSLFMFSK